MTHEGFQKLPFLLRRLQVMEVLDCDKRTLPKMIACGHLTKVVPPGAQELRFRKVQVALLVGFEWESQAQEFWREPLLMREKAVVKWTGYAAMTLERIVQGHGLVRVRPAGMTAGKFRKVEVAELLGLQKYV